jgi:AraC family transcriptional activator of pobA
MLGGGLQDRRLVSPFVSSDETWDIIYLRSGALELTGEQSELFEAPAILCLPHDPQRQIRLAAGSAGAHLAINNIAMTNTLGNRPEALDLTVLINSPIALSLQSLRELQKYAAFTLENIGNETQNQSPGRLVLIEAHLRGLLIHLWREAFQPDTTQTRDGPQTILLRRFRQLVETNFRKRWKVKDYADALNTTSDRLHNVTTSVLGRRPLDLVHERTLREARDLLAKSNLTLDQIAAYLGFATTPHFSSYFRKKEGLPPGRFRSASLAERLDAPLIKSTHFDDWP